MKKLFAAALIAATSQAPSIPPYEDRMSYPASPLLTDSHLLVAPVAKSSAITFVGNGSIEKPEMQFMENGDIFHNGKLITTDKALVEALKKTIEGNCR